MSSLRSSWKRPAGALAQTRLNPASRSRTVWDSRVEGYIILRDLDLYLTRLARDFLLLATKIQSWLKTEKKTTHTHTHAHKIKEKKGRNSWTDSQHFDQTGKIVIVFIQVFLLTFCEGLWLLRVCFLFLLILRAFLGISQSFCLTSDCKLDMSFQNGENASQHPVFPPTPSI